MFFILKYSVKIKPKENLSFFPLSPCSPPFRAPRCSSLTLRCSYIRAIIFMPVPQFLTARRGQL